MVLVNMYNFPVMNNTLMGIAPNNINKFIEILREKHKIERPKLCVIYILESTVVRI